MEKIEMQAEVNFISFFQFRVKNLKSVNFQPCLLIYMIEETHLKTNSQNDTPSQQLQCFSP